MEHFDIGIIGGGPAGYTSALYYKKQGKSVVLFEKDEVGGTCLNRGCIPTKAFLHIADLYSELNGADKLGINFDNLNLDFEKVKEYKNNVVSKLRKGLELTLKNSGIIVIKEQAEITSKDRIKAGETEYCCKKIIVATGSKPKEIKGLEYNHKFILSSDDILELEHLPKSVLIVGSGAIGIEWARILSSFNVEVTIVELAQTLCPLADWEVSKRIERQFKMKKIKTYLTCSVDKIEDKKVTLSNGEIVEPDCVLVAVGREANESKNDFNADVIGDASAEIMLAHYAVSQAKELVFDIPFNKKTVPSVIYGTPGLTTLYQAYEVLHQKILECKKPIFPILPSLHTAGPEVAEFLGKGHVNFSDEVTLATALSQIMQTPPPAPPEVQLYGIDIPRLHKIIMGIDQNGYLSPQTVREILSCAGIPMVPELVSASKEELTAFAQKVGYPVVAKVVGPVHKSDVGGVTLNIRTPEHLALEYDRMMKIEGATAVMVQKMLKGTELFIGAKYEERFGHVVLCGLGGIFVEVLKDVQSGLAPLSAGEAYSMIHSLRGYKILKGTRGQQGINEQKYAEIIVRLSTLLRFATEIKEMDINPLLADEQDVVAVDARILIEK